MKSKATKVQQGRWFTFVLYPQCGAHMDILNFLLDEKVQEKQGFKVAGMLHDRCYYQEGLKKGFPKKSHIHVIMKTENKHTSTAIAKMMGGQRAVLRLYQRDEKHEHSTKLLVPKNEEEQESKDKKNQPAKDSTIPGQQELVGNQPERDSNIPLNSKEPEQNTSSCQQDIQNQSVQGHLENFKKQEGISRSFHHESGDEYPVLVDMGFDELQPVDIEIPPEIWAVMESTDGHHWDSLPQCFYNNPMYPQFRCADNQYWKLVQRQDLSHAEIISDPKAYYLYLQHKDIASIRNHKTPYDEKEFFGNQELLSELRGERGLRYQISQLIEYFAIHQVTNGKQAYEALLYGDCTEELLKFYWQNTSKFSSYFRGMEIELLNQIKEDEKKPDVNNDSSSDIDKPIDYSHKHNREKKEYIKECNEKTAKYLAGKYSVIISNGKSTGNIPPAQQKELQDIAHWFSMHPDEKLFNYVPYEEQLFNIQLYNDIMGSFRRVDVPAPEQYHQYELSDMSLNDVYPDESASCDYDDLIDWDEYKPIGTV